MSKCIEIAASRRAVAKRDGVERGREMSGLASRQAAKSRIDIRVRTVPPLLLNMDNGRSPKSALRRFRALKPFKAHHKVLSRGMWVFLIKLLWPQKSPYNTKSRHVGMICGVTAS